MKINIYQQLHITTTIAAHGAHPFDVPVPAVRACAVAPRAGPAHGVSATLVTRQRHVSVRPGHAAAGGRLD